MQAVLMPSDPRIDTESAHRPFLSGRLLKGSAPMALILRSIAKQCVSKDRT